MSTLSISAFITLFVLLIAVISRVENNTHVYTEMCECKPAIVKQLESFLVCFIGCPITPVNSKLYNISCSHMEEVTVTICEGERFVTTKPIIEVSKEYVLYTLLNKFWKLAITSGIWFILLILKVPSLYTLSLLNIIFSKLIPKKNKQCEVCSSSYSLAHIDCPTPIAKHRTDYNLIYYLFLILILFVTFANADRSVSKKYPSLTRKPLSEIVQTEVDDNKYNTYQHEEYTEIQVVDKEHYKQDFDANGFLYTITILNSHLEMSVVNVSTIHRPIHARIDSAHYSCDSYEDCDRICLEKTGNQTQWRFRKSHDGFSCVFISAVLCGTCSNEWLYLGTRVTATKVSPYIDIEITHGNKTELIQIRDFSKYIHKPYYVKPLAPVLSDAIDLFVVGNKVYKGQICNKPGNGCFGPNYIKDGNFYKYMKPVLEDPQTFDREIVIFECANTGNSDIDSLELTPYIYQNQTLIRPFEFGMISIGISVLGKTVGDFCERLVDVNKVEVSGCYDCQSGIEIVVHYESDLKCAKLRCLVGRVSYEYYIDVHSDKMTIHSFYDKEDLLVDCNTHVYKAKLEHSKDTDYYNTNSGVHGEAPLDFNLWKHIPNLITNIKVVLVTTIAIIISLFITYHIIINSFKNYIKMLALRKLTKRRNKPRPPERDDFLQINYSNVADYGLPNTSNRYGSPDDT